MPTASGSIGGAVFLDANHNGVYEPAAHELLMPGAAVLLTGRTSQGHAVSSTVHTSSGGNFRFDALEPGNYQVSLVNYASFQPAVGTPGSLGGQARAATSATSPSPRARPTSTSASPCPACSARRLPASCRSAA